MIIDKKCTCGSKSTGNTTIRCCNLCGLPIPNEPWHFNLDENIFSQVEKPVMLNFAEVIDKKIRENKETMMRVLRISTEKTVTWYELNMCNNQLEELKEELSKISA